MHMLLMRCLLIVFCVLPAAAVKAEVDGHALYLHIAPVLADHHDKLAVACKGGNAQACDARQNLVHMLGAFQRTDEVCQTGDAQACQHLGIAIGVLLVGSRCNLEGDATACARLADIRAIAPACSEGNGDACDEIEFALFGRTPQQPPTAPAPAPRE